MSTASGTTSTTLSATVAIGSNQRHRLRGASAFAGLFKAGRRLNGAHLQLLASPAERSVGRVGFVIGKKLLAGAVERNYLRRLLREAVRQRRPALDSFDIVLRLRTPCPPRVLPSLLHEASELLATLTDATDR
ncbi:MAG: ribonuclease P protein component [Betaproteobacteria bacterium]|nr:MAG: ribonuclease P protein component [Betaproteobacteria bacterium]